MQWRKEKGKKKDEIYMYNDVKRNRKQKIGKHETEWKKNAVNFIFSRFLFLL